MPMKKTFTNPVDNKQYTIRQFIKSKNNWSGICGTMPMPKLYVGKMIQQLRTRISKHISSINTQADTPLA